MSEQSRKVLEEIQKHKHLLKQQGAAAPNIGLTYTQQQPQTTPGTTPDVHLTPSQRLGNQTLQQTNATSFGSFVYQESHFGNSILPVLPRLDTATTTAATTIQKQS